MHTFDRPFRSPHSGQIPAMRPPHEAPGRSGTPIYDALYAEYRRLFRALPGDRTGEEELRFTGFQPWAPDEASQAQGGRHRGAQPALPPGGARPTTYDNRMRGL